MLFALPRNFELLGVGFYLVFSQFNSLPRILRSSAIRKGLEDFGMLIWAL